MENTDTSHKHVLKPTIDSVVNNAMCLGCGVCADSCPFHAIKFVEYNGLKEPRLDHKLCHNHGGCNLCYRVCPGHGIDLGARSKALFESQAQNDPYIGPYVECLYGWSTDHDIRYHSASGGVLSQFLIYLLEHKVADGVVVTRFKANNPLRPEPFIATTKEEVLSARSSKYCPVSMDGMIRRIESFPGKVIVVGLPCHIQGFRKCASLSRRLREKVVGHFAIYCSSNRNYRAIDSILKHHEVAASEVQSFAFRDNGCLGSLEIRSTRKSVSEHFTKYYGRLRSFYKPKRCLTCFDHYGMLADVSFGDVHLAPYFNEIGVNSLIVRNSQFADLLREATADGVLELKPMPAEDVNRSQAMMFKNRDISVPFYLKWEKLLGRRTPEYDVQLGSVHWVKGLKIWLSNTIQAAIGRFR